MKVEEVKMYLASRRANAARTVEQFATSLGASLVPSKVGSPLDEFHHGAGVIEAAAMIEVIDFASVLIEACEENDDDDDGAIRCLLTSFERDVLRLARRRSSSTSPIVNLAERMKLSAYAEIVEDVGGRR